MTKLKIISRLWSHVTDLRMLLRGITHKTLEQIEAEIDETEYYCRPYADVDDEEALFMDEETEQVFLFCNQFDCRESGGKESCHADNGKS